MDLRDVKAEHLEGFDAVMHLGALSNDPLGDRNPQFTYDINLSLNGPTRFFGPILRPILRRNLGKDLERFRNLVETSSS